MNSLVLVKHGLNVADGIAANALDGFRVANLRKSKTAASMTTVQAKDIEDYLNAVIRAYVMASTLSALYNSNDPYVTSYLIEQGITGDRVLLWGKVLKSYRVPDGLGKVLRAIYSPVQLSSGTLVVVVPDGVELSDVTLSSNLTLNTATYYINTLYEGSLSVEVRSKFEDLVPLVTTEIEAGAVFSYPEEYTAVLPSGIHMGTLSNLQSISKYGPEGEQQLTRNSLFGSADNNIIVNEFVVAQFINGGLGDSRADEKIVNQAVDDFWTSMFSVAPQSK